MAEPLHTISYISRSTLDGDPTAALADIVGHARLRNEQAGLTGALICSPHHFAQVLEGPLAALEETFERISRDRRHRDITVLFSNPVPSRSFEGWGMASAGVTEDDTDLKRVLDLVSPDARVSVSDAAGQRTMDLLARMLKARELS